MLFNRIKRPVAGTVLFTFLALVLQPLSVLAQDRPQSAASRAATGTGEEKFSRTLNEIHEILKEVAPHAAMPHMFPAGKPGEMELRAIGPNMKIEVERAKPLPGVDVAKKVSQLREKAKELASLEQHVRTGFDDTARHIKDKNLPAEILARHEEAVKAYEARAAEFKALVGALERTAGAGGAALQTALTDLAAFMAKYPNQKTHTPTDPNNLPWGTPKPVTREPYTSPSQFRTSRLFGEPVRVAQAGNLSGISLPSTTLPATPVPADTAPTEDVQITQPIRDLAASLNNNPVQIYNWVRNNIEFIPSYGSIQGSDMTLQTKRGNSFDTASLLIALLRAANVPARYVYGTIELPADKAMNWVGGVTVPRAATILLGQGGIPVVGVGQSGQIAAVRLEHVWVEAFVDYLPSRGAVNRNPNTWVPLDASFKQYQIRSGMDIAANVPFDPQGFVNQIQAGSTVNEAEGWIQNFNQTLIQQTLADYQARTNNYVGSQNPAATVGDVLGGRTIIQENRPILLGTLPYKRIATGAKFQAIPENLRWQFRYYVYANDTDRAFDNPFIAYTRSTPSLAGKKIALSFSPASQADADLIASFLPAPNADGTPFDPSQIPASLPGYLIRLKPELRIKGELVATGPVFTMGAELIQEAAYFNPAWGAWESGEPNRPTVGEYIATALDLQGISAGELGSLKTDMEATRAKLDHLRQNPDDLSVIQSLSKEALPGDLLYSAVLSYFAAIDSAAQISALSARVSTVRMPSFGNFGMAATVQFSFGTARRVSFPAFQMDIDRVVGSEVAKNGDNTAVVAFRRSVGGTYSANEHLLPERLFQDPNRPANDPTQPQALSAVKALAVAASQGQRIYILNSQNEAIHASAINRLALDPDVRHEIGNALSAGREVIVHEAKIFLSGFQGSGHIIIDPQTGAGAYKISSGASGGYVVAQGGMALFYLIQLISGLRALGFIAGMLLVANPVSAGILLLVAAVTLIGALLADNPYQQSTLSQQLLVITLLTTIGAIAFVISPILFAFIFFALLLYIARILTGIWLTLHQGLKPYARQYA